MEQQRGWGLQLCPPNPPIQNRWGLLLPPSHRFGRTWCPLWLSSSHTHAGEQDTCLGGEMENKSCFSPCGGCSLSFCVPALLHSATISLRPVPFARPVATSSMLAHWAMSLATYLLAGGWDPARDQCWPWAPLQC